MKYVYTYFDIAVYLTVANLTVSDERNVLNNIWEQRNDLGVNGCNEDKRQFIHSIKHELHIMEGYLECADELNLILKELGSKYNLNKPEYEQGAVESYFKVIKLRLLYSPGTDHCKIKLRKLIGRFGYKRRTAALIDCISDTINLLGLRLYLLGWEACDISSVSLDDMIIIRRA